MDRIKDKNPKDLEGRTPLHEAVKNGHDEVACIILDIIGDENPKDLKGCTPLHEAAKWGHDQIFKLLMDKVEDKNPEDQKGVTPFHEAAFGGSEKICEMILEVVDDKNPKDHKGKYPVHWIQQPISEVKNPNYCFLPKNFWLFKNTGKFRIHSLGIGAEQEIHMFFELGIHKIVSRVYKFSAHE